MGMYNNNKIKTKKRSKIKDIAWICRVRTKEIAIIVLPLLVVLSIIESTTKYDPITNIMYLVKCCIANVYDTYNSPRIKATFFENTEESIDTYLALLDGNFIEDFYREGTIGFYTEEELKLKKEGTTGTFYTGTCAIRLRDSIITRWDGSVLHELGHYYSYKSGYADTTEFKQIYEEEKGKFKMLDSYATKTSEEFFAETFRCYIVTPNFLKIAAPKAYEYINLVYTASYT